MIDPEPKLEPVEIQHAKLRRRLFGYRRGDVDELLETVTAHYEAVWYDREALRNRVETLLDDLERARDRDRLVGDVVRNAQRVADETIADARMTAESLLAKTRRRAQELLADAQRDPERLREELRGLTTAERTLHERFRTFCSLARDVLDGDTGDDVAATGGRSSTTIDAPERGAATSAA